jgi:transposase-like protein
MSTSTKVSTKGVRYSDEQKKEVVDFAIAYNAENGRGGQSKAAEKFNISQLTAAAWLKAAGAPSSKGKAAKKAQSPKAKKASNGSKGVRASRYSDELKKEILDFTAAYNETNGRGGQSQAAAKFNISPLTIMAWLKAGGVKSSGQVTKQVKAVKVEGLKATSTPKISSGGNLDAKLSSLLTLSKQISKAEAELAQLNAKFKSLKESL